MNGKIIGALFCSLILAGSAVRAESIPMTNVLMTVWGRAVTPENVWREYPRPQLVRGNWMSLNGLWDYAIVSSVAEEPRRWEGRILVPFGVEAPLSGVRRKVTPRDQIWYRRTFDCPARPGTRTLLNFEAVDYRAQVFVNGIEVTDVPHEGGSTPFSVDVTDAVRLGENELKVSVWDPTDDHLGATGKQILNRVSCFFVPLSGICGSVWCETVPATYLADYRVDSDPETGIVTVTPHLGGVSQASEVSVEVLFKGALVAKGTNAGKAGPIRISLPRPLNLWSPESPNLYDLRLVVSAGGVQDEATGYFGIRKIEGKIDANGIRRPALNGAFTYFLGTLDQGWWPDGYLTPPSPDGLRFDVDFNRKAGFNTIRKHMKIEPRLFYAYCDMVGMMVVQDLPGHPVTDFDKGNRRYATFRRELKEVVDLLHNHPSIMMWQPFNEGWGQPSADKTRHVAQWLKRYDPSRLVDGPSGWFDFERAPSMPFEEKALKDQGVTPGEFGFASDVVDRHYYPMAAMFPPNRDRISIVGEYGGLWACFKDHFYDPLGNKYEPEPLEGGDWRERNRKGYEDLANPLVEMARKGLGGSFFTEGIDCFWEGGGLVTFDRAIVKVDYAVMREIHARILEAALTASADVSKFDERIAADTSLASADGLRWLDAATLPMESKVCAETATPYGRIPADLMDKVPDGVRGMACHSTGHYFLFRTDSDKLGVRWQCTQVTAPDPYIPPQGMYGVDIYVKRDGIWRFVKNGRLGDGSWQETRADLPGRGEREVLVYLPIRADVRGVRLGIAEDRRLVPCGHASGIVKPVVHYGTSLVHGGCASRPGLTFTAQAARKADAPYVNLGFSGCARLEPIMADVMARKEASLYIIDPVWNCDEKKIDERTEPFVRRLHALRPTTPILLCEGPEAAGCRMDANEAMKRAYERLKADPALAGLLHYLPAEGLLPTDGEATHDYIHPNDYGSMRMGEVFGRKIAEIVR